MSARPWRPRLCEKPYSDSTPVAFRLFWYETRKLARASSWTEMSYTLRLIGATRRLSRNILPPGRP